MNHAHKVIKKYDNREEKVFDGDLVLADQPVFVRRTWSKFGGGSD